MKFLQNSAFPLVPVVSPRIPPGFQEFSSEMPPGTPPLSFLGILSWIFRDIRPYIPPVIQLRMDSDILSGIISEMPSEILLKSPPTISYPLRLSQGFLQVSPTETYVGISPLQRFL